MIDFILGLALAGMLIRGWSRGFVREALDLVGLIVGIWIAFRLSAPFGDFLSESFGVAPEVARIGGGVILFVLFGVLLSIAAHYLSKVMNLPGLSMVNRVGGAAVAVGWGVVILLVLISIAAVSPIPESWQDQLEDSRVVSWIAGEDAVPRQVFETMAGDNVMAAIASIQDVFGSARAVPEGDEILEFPRAQADEIRQVRDEAEDVLDKINEDRVSAGLRAVTAVGPVTELAEERAAGLYVAGFLRRIGDCSTNLADRSYNAPRCDNMVALAGTALGAYEGIKETAQGATMISNPDLDRAGVAVVDGPTGRLVVVILAG